MFKTNVWDLSTNLLNILEEYQKSEMASPDEWVKIIKNHDESIKNKPLECKDLIAQMLEKSANGEINSYILHLITDNPNNIKDITEVC